MLPINDQIELEFRKIIDAETYEEWMKSPNAELDFKTPRDLLAQRQYSMLWAFIYHHRMVISR